MVRRIFEFSRPHTPADRTHRPSSQHVYSPSPPYHRYDETLETIDAPDREHDNEPEERVADVTGKEASELRHFLRLGDAFAACYAWLTSLATRLWLLTVR